MGVNMNEVPKKTRTRLRIGVVATCPLHDRWAASGVPFAITQALKDYCGEVIELGPFISTSDTIDEKNCLEVGKGYHE